MKYALIFLTLFTTLFAHGTGEDHLHFFSTLHTETFVLFIVGFIAIIFRDNDSRMPVLFATLNGITIGFLIPNMSFAEDVYNSVLYYLMWHIVISVYIFTTLAVYSFREAKHTQQKIPKAGFRLIGSYGIFVDLVFVFFILDLIIGTINESGYTAFYYLAWTSGGISVFFAYLGYVMPNWLKNRLEK